MEGYYCCMVGVFSLARQKSIDSYLIDLIRLLDFCTSFVFVLRPVVLNSFIRIVISNRMFIVSNPVYLYSQI